MLELVVERKLFFTAQSGKRLCGVLLSPSGKSSELIVVMAHGFRSDKDGDTFSVLKKTLARRGIASFRFDFHGRGESEGNFAETTITEAVEDVLSVVVFVKNKLRYKRVVLVGSSFGGTASIIATPKIRGLSGLILKTPASDYDARNRATLSPEQVKKWRTDGYRMIEKGGKLVRLNYSFFQDCKVYDCYKLAEEIKIPTLIVHGGRDVSVPVGQSVKLARKIRGSELVVMSEADHRYSDPKDLKEMIDTITRFISSHFG